MCRVVQIYGVFKIFLAGKSSNIRSYTVYIYGSGQLYVCVSVCVCARVYVYVYVCHSLECLSQLACS